jgi:glycosyltransferase involved in cell wall biosynthesis
MLRQRCDVVHMVNQMRPGGIETMVADLVQQSQHHSRIISLEGATAGLLRDWPGLAPLADRVEGFERAPRLDPALVFRLARRLRVLAPHAVFLHRINPFFYGGLAARMARVPVIVHVEHDVWHYAEPRRRRLLVWTARLVRPSHFAISDKIAGTLGEMLPFASIRVVPGGVDLKRFRSGDRGLARASLGLPVDVPVIGTAGRLEAVKGHRTLVAAMEHLPTDVRLLIIGDGSEHDRLNSLASELGVGKRVSFLGHRDDVHRLLPALDVFCLPSLREGLPRVVMEAQGAGIPVVASDVGSVRQVVDSTTGRLVPADNPIALAAAIKATLSAAPSADAIRRYAEAHFSIESMIAAYDRMTPRRTPSV